MKYADIDQVDTELSDVIDNISASDAKTKEGKKVLAVLNEAATKIKEIMDDLPEEEDDDEEDEEDAEDDDSDEEEEDDE